MSSASSVASSDKPDDDTAKARALYAEGLSLSKSYQWSDALAAFERSSALRPHPSTTFNVGFCQRALGRYVEARGTFLRALAEDAAANPRLLPETTVDEAKRYLTEIAQLAVHLTVRVKPSGAKVTLDGLPLVVDASKDPPEGAAKAAKDGGVSVDVNPGVHLLQVSRKGFAEVVVTKTFKPGSTVELPIDLEQLPCKIRVEADLAPAYVKIDGRDIGMAPIETERAAGAHRIEVEKDGYVTYASTVNLEPGGRADLRAKLTAESSPVTKKWWFWGGIAAVVVGGVTVTYFLTRPAPEPPPYDGGRLGWVVPSN